MKKVVIVQRRLTHYRVPFFELLRVALAQKNIQLVLLYGNGTAEEEMKHDAGNIAWGYRLPTTYLFHDKVCWQPVYRYINGASLVIVTQENALLVNLVLLFFPRRYKLAFWGHGANLQSANPHGLKERFKRWISKRVDWWFAYTDMSAGLVTENGYPRNHITVVNNSVDTNWLDLQLKSISEQERLEVRNSLGATCGSIGLYVGSLYSLKRLDFLFAAAECIYNLVSDFRLVIVGDGPERDKVRSWCDSHHWAHWVGNKHGKEKALYLSVSDVMLNPGLIGLGVLDAFVSGTPIVTTQWHGHSPEICYLINGYNGVITPNDVSKYADAVVRLLTNPEYYIGIQDNCINSATKYTLENMVCNFVCGIEHALARARV